MADEEVEREERVYLADVPEKCPACGASQTLAWRAVPTESEMETERDALICAFCGQWLAVHTKYGKGPWLERLEYLDPPRTLVLD